LLSGTSKLQLNRVRRSGGMNLYWIKAGNFQLAIIPRPRGGDWLPDDIEFMQRAEFKCLLQH